ncbi:MAG: response regulator [Alphaproteobacteria bacterium]|nr:response regulator [Alphaproteobacteria bacterium]
MTSSQHILIVDDHRDIRDPLKKYLTQNGYRVTTAGDASEARQVLTTHKFDIALLDIMMPGEDGLSLCRYVQSSFGVPVILLTAMSEDTDKIIGLELGADDYVAKPFNPRELLARIKAVLRRSQAALPTDSKQAVQQYHFDNFIFDCQKRAVINNKSITIPLSTGEFDLLMVFVTHPAMTLNRDQLLDLTKGREAMPFDRSIDNQVSRLRKKLEKDPKTPQLIQTVWGGGYIFTPEVQQI